MHMLMEMVERFNREVIGLPVPNVPTALSPERKRHAIGHLYEEALEFELAKTMEDEADALLDLAYVALGRILEMGLAPLVLFEEVHDANMRRVRGNKPNRDANNSGGYDAVKPEGWTGPDLLAYLMVSKLELDTLLDHRDYLEATGYDRKLLQDDKTVADCKMKFDNLIKPTFLPAIETPDVEGFRQLQDELALQNPANLKDKHVGVLGQFDGQVIPLVDPDELTGHIETTMPKILVLGYARHGKDTVSEMLRDEYDLSFTSSSMFCAEHVLLPWFKKCGHLYLNAEACFEDRMNHRSTWYEQIQAYNTPDRSALGRAIFAEHDIYCGLRSEEEFLAIKDRELFDVCVWIDATDREPVESQDSCTVYSALADHIIDNNGDLDDLRKEVFTLFDTIIPDSEEVL